jgi:hypothetical protein
MDIMDAIERIEHDNTTACLSGPANDSRQRCLSLGQSWFPADAVARISRPSRSVTTSAPVRRRQWLLTFERRTPPCIEPLMGWTGGDDPLTQIRLTFPTCDAAIAYAERQGLTYVVDGDQQWPEARVHHASSQHTMREQTARDAWSTYVQYAWLQSQYGRGAPNLPDLERALINPAAVFAAPDDVLKHAALTLQDKRAILQRWAWDEYLLQLASDEAMPEGRESSRLEQVKSALLALDEIEQAALVVAVPSRPKRHA